MNQPILRFARRSCIAAALLATSCSSGGNGGSPCTAGSACAPTNPCHVGVQACVGGSPSCMDTSSNVADGAACGSGHACSSGTCVAACVAGQPCSPSGAADPCKTYATTCNATATQTNCAVAADAPDRTVCGSQLVCVAGACVPSIRTVSATFQTTYWPDAGGKTTLSSPPPDRWTAKALLVPDATAAGYTSVPITLDANQGFSLPDIAAGPYFLQLDRKAAAFCQGCSGDNPDVEVVETRLIELRGDSLDLTVLSAARPDLLHADMTTLQPILQLEVNGLVPWTTGDSVLTASSQAFHYGKLSGSRATAGATAVSGPWGWATDGLVDASKGDVFYAYQRSTTPVGSGSSAGTVSAASKYARLTDLTLTQNSTGASVTLSNSAPQTSAVRADLRYSQFAALAASVHPSAVPSVSVAAGFSVQAVPHSVEYPDMPYDFQRTSLLLVSSAGTPTVDMDYGTVHYGEFLDPLWKNYRLAAYAFDAQVPIAAAPAGVGWGLLVSMVPLSTDPGPIAPALGPPTVPRIEGRDAFSDQTGVGLQPTITWSPPALGHATSYQVTIARQTQPVITGETRILSAIVYSAREFRLPAGFLQQGGFYTATITARSGPWDTFDHPPFRSGTPFHTADCLTSIFRP